MIGHIVATGYILIGIVTSRALMRIIMTRQICVVHREGWFTGKCFGYHDRPRRTETFGSTGERPISIALFAVGAGLVWPLTGMVALAMRAKPVSGELERVNKELAEKIARLEKDAGLR